jgi:nucleoside-diphosphate-sugar epimerase
VSVERHENTMNVLILGSGYTGSRLARWLISKQVGVSLTTRSGQLPPALANLQPPCFKFDSETDSQLPEVALQGITHVVSTMPPDSKGQDPVVHRLLPQLTTKGLVWFGYLSTTGVYGDTQGAWVTETSPVNPQNQRSQNRVDAEQALLAAPLVTHIFRLPGIYGPSRSTFERIQQGNAQRIERPGHVFSRIHVDDIVQTLWASMQQPTPGEIFNIGDDLPCEPSALIMFAYHLLGQPAPEPIQFGTVTLSPMATSFWQECRRVSNQKIKEKLGVKLLYPTYQEGLQAIWQQLVNSG